MDYEFSERERTREEEDELQRSTKKVKETTSTSEFGSPPSYRDKLVGEISGAFAQAFNLSTSNEGVSFEPVDLGDVAKDMIAVTLNPETRRPSNATYNLVAVWLRLPELPFEFYNPGVLKEIGSAIGPVLQVDSYTASEARGRYARICVQVDLNKPLIKSILLEGHWKEGCPYSVKANLSTSTLEQESKSGEEEVDVMASNNSQEAGTSNMNPKNEYGPWFEGLVSYVTSNNPRGNARGAHGPVDALRSKGNIGKPKQTSSSGVKIIPITSNIALPQAPSLNFLQKQTPPTDFLFSSKSSDKASTT
nr:hypothetical protein CFP56_56762 [Quercus suber]